MQTLMKILLSAGVAAASMYYLDPSRGNERRADARARLEHGKDELSRRAGKLDHDARNLAAGAAGTFASFLNRNRSHGKARAALRVAPRAKVLLIPGTWIVTVGLGAATMYYFDSLQGQSRRKRLRARLAGWRDEVTETMRAIGRKLPVKAEEPIEIAKEITNQMIGNGSADSLRTQDRLQDRPLQDRPLQS